MSSPPTSWLLTYNGEKNRGLRRRGKDTRHEMCKKGAKSGIVKFVLGHISNNCFRQTNGQNVVKLAQNHLLAGFLLIMERKIGV